MRRLNAPCFLALPYQMRDRLSFVRFLGLALEDKVPDAKACPELDSGTVWLYREQLSQAGVIEVLFDDFDDYLKDQGFQVMGGQSEFIGPTYMPRAYVWLTRLESPQYHSRPPDWPSYNIAVMKCQIKSRPCLTSPTCPRTGRQRPAYRVSDSNGAILVVKACCGHVVESATGAVAVGDRG